jgi:KUP system potassium uptake protein
VAARLRISATDHPGMATWRERLFALLVRNATDVGNFFHLPAGRTVEIGQRVDI